MTMKNDISLDEFCYELENILTEKYPKYFNTWTTTPLGTLRSKIEEQLKSLVMANTIEEMDYITKEKAKRKLLHIANYCFFLFNRLGEGK